MPRQQKKKKKKEKPESTNLLQRQQSNTVNISQSFIQKGNIVIALFSLIAIFIFFGMINEYALNLPVSDDYDAILGFLNNWHNSTGFTQKMSLLFSQHNEHRILSSRIVYVLYYTFFGKINFITLIYIGTFQLIVTAGLLSYFTYKLLYPAWGFAVLVLSFCIINPANWENSDFAMAGMQNYGVIMFFLLSLFFYSKPSAWYFIVVAFIFQLISAFSSGNGFMAGMALVLFNILRKEKLKIIISSIALVVFTLLYFYHYQSYKFLGSHSISDDISYFLYLCGNCFGQNGNRPIYGLLMLLMLAATIFYKTKFYSFISSKTVAPFISVLVFIFLSMVAVSISRSGGNKNVTIWAYTSRYFIYPEILIVIVFLFVWKRLENFKFKWVVIGVFSVLLLAAYQVNYDYGERGFYSFYNNSTLKKFNYSDTVHAKNVANESCANGIYCIEENRP